MANLLGQRFGRLTVIEDLGSVNKRRLWLCQCDCGNTIKCTTTALRRKDGGTKSCGCLQKERTSETSRKNIQGLRSGKLVALEPTDMRKKNEVVWKCQCDCGNIHYVPTSLLTGKKVQSCGCTISRGNQRIHSLLQENDTLFIPEYPVRINGRNYYFDFAILNTDNSIKAMVEYDGIQHYQDAKNITWGTAKEIQARDEIKNTWCKEQKIQLIRIPYTDFEILDLNYLHKKGVI